MSHTFSLKSPLDRRNNVSLIALIFSEEVYFTKHSQYTVLQFIYVIVLETGKHMLMKGKM